MKRRPTGPKRRLDMRNCAFSIQDQKDILASALKIGIVPTARFYQNENGKRPSETFVYRLLTEARKQADWKGARLSWINEEQCAKIRAYYKGLDSRQTTNLNHRLKLIADEFSTKLKLAISVGAVAKILEMHSSNEVT